MTRLLVKHLTFPLYQRWKGDRVLTHLPGLMETQSLTPGEMHDLRMRKLRRLLEHAYRNTAFYRRRFDEAGFDPGRVRDFSDLERLPVLTKSEIVTNLEDLRAANLRDDEVHRSATGGSTGRRTPFFRDNRCLSFKRAVELRFNRWTGWDIGRRIARVWPALQDFSAGKSTLKARIRNELVDRSLVLPSGKLDEAILAGHARALRAFSPFLIRAFSNPLHMLARFLKETGGAPIRPGGIIVTGEPLLPSQRGLIEEVFDCPVYNLYASRETGHMACECEVHSGLHIAVEGVHLEFVRDGRAVPAGQPGQVLATDLENLGMPFIRYQIQDIGVPLDRACPCGRSLPLMAFEAGRISDFIVSPRDGALISGSSLCHYLIAEGPDVGQIQIIQDARDHLTILIRRPDRPEDDHAERIDRFRGIMDRIFEGAMSLTIELVDSIPHEASGKYRFCINRVPSESWASSVRPELAGRSAEGAGR